MASRTLSIELLLESKSFTASMQKVNDAFEKSNKHLQTFGKNLQKAGAGMAAAGASITAALGLAVKSLANAADTADDTAKRTGLTVEAVQELGYAAKMCGTDLGTVEIALRTMQRNLADTGAESATFKGALEAMGINLKELRQMNPQEQFDTLTKAIAGVKDASQRAGLAMAVFGRSGTALLPMLAEGTAGIARLKNEAHQYGYVMSREVAEAGSNFNDNLDRLKGSVGGLAQQVAAGLLPGLNSLARAMADAVVGVKDWVSAHPGLVSALAKAAAALGAALTVFGGLVAACGAFITLAPALGMAFTVATGPVGQAVALLAGVTAAIIALYKNWDTVCHYMAQAWDALTITVCEGVKLWLSAWEKALGWIPGVGEKLRTAMYAAQEASAQAAFDIGQRQIAYEKEKNERILAETRKNELEKQNAYIGTETILKDINKKKKENAPLTFSEGWKKAFEETKKAMLDWKEIAGQLFTETADNLAGVFSAAIFQIGDGWSGLYGTIKDFGQKMLNSVVDMLAQIVSEWVMKTVVLQGLETAYAAFKSALLAQQTAQEVAHLEVVTAAKTVAAKQQIAANSAVAGSEAAASSAGWALWGAVAIGAAIMAAVLAFADGFAAGGIVGGNSFTGDKVLTRVNSGEMILNQAQQARLFEMANGAPAEQAGAGAVINQTINVSGGGDLNAITQAIKRGTTEALEFANVAYKAGQKRNKYVG